MLTNVMKKRVQRRFGVGHHPRSVDLYRFIRLVLRSDSPAMRDKLRPAQAGGSAVNDVNITRRWKMDGNNFYGFKTGRYPVPRLERLESLARLLGVNKHMIFQVAGGASADKVFNLIKKNDLPGQIKLLQLG